MTDFELTKCCALMKFGCSNAAAKAVLVTLAAMSRNGSVGGYTSDQLAAVCCVQRHAFLKAVSWLEEQKLIDVKRHAGVKSTFTFNEDLIASKGVLSVESAIKKVSVESDTECRIQQEKLSVESVTDSVANPSLNQCRIHNSISAESDTVYKKEKEKEKIINQSVPMGNSAPVASVSDLKNCFQSFGSNPVARPTQWQPDEDDFDQPLQNQIAQAQRIEVDISDDSHKLNASEMVVLAATLGYRITHNVVLDEIADERVITTAMFKEAIQRTKDNAGSAGYLIRILQNAIKDPDAFNGIRKKPDVTADTLSDGQAYHFAKSLANYHPWASNNAKYMETMEQMIDRVSVSIKNPEFFNNCRWALEKLGLVKEAAA